MTDPNQPAHRSTTTAPVSLYIDLALSESPEIQPLTKYAVLSFFTV